MPAFVLKDLENYFHRGPSALAFAVFSGSIFYCPGCGAFKSCEEGADDDDFDLCDDCANHVYRFRTITEPTSQAVIRFAVQGFERTEKHLLDALKKKKKGPRR